MSRLQVLGAEKELASEIARCCKQYSSLDIAVAWCGDPKFVLPYEVLGKFEGPISITVGISFKHTHPDAIVWFKEINADIRVYRDSAVTFHPKLYLFSKGSCYALLIGSSNFTFSGFCANVEANVLIEGTRHDQHWEAIAKLRKQMDKWHSHPLSFRPKDKWIENYTREFEAAAKRARKYNIETPSRQEEHIPVASWLRTASWPVYYKKVTEGLKRRKDHGASYHKVIDAAGQKLSIPWGAHYFEDIERRRIIGGMGEYGALGHVAAAGMFRSLLANGSKRQWNTIVLALNHIAKLNTPIQWNVLESELRSLIGLGFTMKVWGRLLCIVRPDLFCTVAAPSVRANLSKTLKMPQTYFERPQGYIRLVKLIHASPWYNSKKPKNAAEAAIWGRRVAFLDAVFY